MDNVVTWQLAVLPRLEAYAHVYGTSTGRQGPPALLLLHGLHTFCHFLHESAGGMLMKPDCSMQPHTAAAWHADNS